MKLKFIALVSFIIISLVFLTGCDEIESILGPAERSPNYIVVTVNADFCVYNDEDNSPCANEPLQVQIIKAGGEGIDEMVYTNSEGCTSATATFYVYKDQPVDVNVYCHNHPHSHDNSILPWEVTKSSSIQGRYTWEPFFVLFV